MYKRFVKRVLDILFSFLGTVILSPLMILTAILVRIDSKGPAIFKQDRIGKGGKIFKIYKFRSMAENSEHTGSGVYSGADDMRVTRVGRIIRATSIDELPQLVNILKGDMSFIGPRPPLTYHPWPLEEYTEEQLRMFEVRPGITGWAQTHGRKNVEWHERIGLNIFYVDNCSLIFDIKILFLTVYKVIKNDDNVNDFETLTDFDFSKKETSTEYESIH